MRRIIPIFTLIASTAVSLVPIARADETGTAMADAARRFLAEPDQPQRASLARTVRAPRSGWRARTPIAVGPPKSTGTSLPIAR